MEKGIDGWLLLVCVVVYVDPYGYIFGGQDRTGLHLGSRSKRVEGFRRRLC